MAAGGVSSIENNVKIQDIVCVAPIPEGLELLAGEHRKTDKAENNELERMYRTIEDLVNIAAQEHKSNNCDDNHRLKTDCKNNITRLITYEFCFYTQNPLKREKFAELLEKLINLASKQPDNLHLVLGSFAVLAPSDKVMSVVPHIECGSKVKLNLIVKNYPAAADPEYKKMAEGTDKFPTMGVTTEWGKEGDYWPEHLAMKKIVGKNEPTVEGLRDELEIKNIIKGKNYPFSFNNVLICKTAGGKKFFSCVELCLDHNKGAAKSRLKNILDNKLEALNNTLNALTKKESLPVRCSHILISNTHGVLPSKKLADAVTHADPLYSRDECKSAPGKEPYDINPHFGFRLTIITTMPITCGPVSDNDIRNKIDNYNIRVKKSFLSTVSSKLLGNRKKKEDATPSSHNTDLVPPSTVSTSSHSSLEQRDLLGKLEDQLAKETGQKNDDIASNIRLSEPSPRILRYQEATADTSPAPALSSSSDKSADEGLSLTKHKKTPSG